jgi:hypothetical protein
MNIFSMILGLLPTLILAIEKVSGDLAGHQKKQIVTDLLTSTAAAVGQVSPGNAATAKAAAALAAETLDSVVAILKSAKGQTVPVTTQETAAAAVAGQ